MVVRERARGATLHSQDRWPSTTTMDTQVLWEGSGIPNCLTQPEFGGVGAGSIPQEHQWARAVIRPSDGDSGNCPWMHEGSMISTGGDVEPWRMCPWEEKGRDNMLRTRKVMSRWWARTLSPQIRTGQIINCVWECFCMTLPCAVLCMAELTTLIFWVRF